MTAPSIAATIGRTGLLLALLAPGTPIAGAHAAEIRLLTFSSSRPIFVDAAPAFERVSGHKLLISYGSVEPQRDQVAAGEPADVIISSRPLIDDLARRGRLAPGGTTDLARITIRLFARTGAPKPDIAGLAALKAALLAAPSVAFTNPTRGALAGRSFADALKRMDIYDQVLARAKVIQGLGDEVVAAVLRGEASIGAGPTNDVTPLPAGIAILGPLPKELGSDVMIAAGLIADARAPEAAAALIRFLASPAGHAAMTAHGLEP
jgi:molybdate transport system substrate-binding protein